MSGSPRAVLMCPPDHFDVIDVKNAFMASTMEAGRSVDGAAARTQWQALAAAFGAAGVPVEVLPATPGCEDMVFTANPSLPGRRADDRPVCVLSRMKYASRQREVPAHAAWFRAQGYDVLDVIPHDVCFEGCGDALWHADRHLLWIGAGERTNVAAHALVAAAFDVEVRSLHLVDPRFYHLDTCLCVLDAHRALVYAEAFDAASLRFLEQGFDELLRVDEDEAVRGFACNAAALPDGTVLIDHRAAHTAEQLDRLGYRPVPVDTGEFLKSGGSAFCMKQFVY